LIITVAMNADTAFGLQDMEIHVVDCQEFFVPFGRAFLTEALTAN
jgi:hypothetical protein